MKQRIALLTASMMIGLRAGEGLELSYESADQVPAEYEKLYTEKDGKYVLTGVKGMKTQADIDRLQASLTKERNDHKAIKQQYAALNSFGSVDEIVSNLERIPELEAGQGKGDPKDLDKVVAAKTAPLERTIKQLQDQIVEKDGLIGGYKQKETQQTVKAAVTKAAAELKLKAGAIDDAVMYGERILTIDESGNVVTKDGVGVTPFLDAKSWLTEILPTKQHWIEDSFGGGSQGGKGQEYETNPYSADNWDITKQMALYRTNPAKAQQMAKRHGVDPLNPVRPAKKA